jgi:hypothetical protein
MVLSQKEFVFAEISENKYVKDLFSERIKAKTFYDQVVYDRAIQEQFGFVSLERNYNTWIIHHPLDFLNQEPADGLENYIIPANWKPPMYRLNKRNVSRELRTIAGNANAWI